MLEVGNLRFEIRKFNIGKIQDQENSGPGKIKTRVPGFITQMRTWGTLKRQNFKY